QEIQDRHGRACFCFAGVPMQGGTVRCRSWDGAGVGSNAKRPRQSQADARIVSSWPNLEIPVNEECHGDSGEMRLRARHQKEAVDGVILDASGWKSARQPSLFGGNTRLLDGGLR